jgi:hypothetical protein
MPRLDDDGQPIVPTVGLAGRTLVYDRERDRQVMWINGVLVLPVGAVIELTEPNVHAVVEGARLLAGHSEVAAMVCLDVRVPAEYWSGV